MGEDVGPFARGGDELGVGLVAAHHPGACGLRCLAVCDVPLDQPPHARVRGNRRAGLGFLPWFPLGAGDAAESEGAVARIAAERDASPVQVALAWLLHRSPAMLPIPGTSSLEHLEENVAAAGIELDQRELEVLDAVA